MWRVIGGLLVLSACGGPSVCDHPPTWADALVCSTGREIRVGGPMLDWQAGKPEPSHAQICGYECQGSPWVSYWRYSHDPNGPAPVKLCACRDPLALPGPERAGSVLEIGVSLDPNVCRLSVEQWAAFAATCPK